MENDIKEILFSQAQLKEIVNGLGERISKDYEGKELILVSVLKGSVVFMGDLMRAIKIPCYIDFMSVSSYGSGTKSSGIVKIIKDLDTNVIEGKNLLIVEDILDSGDPALKDKIIPDYSGAVIPDAFVVGYGLDYNEKYRNLPYVGILKPSVYGGE